MYEVGQIHTPKGEQVPPFIHGVEKHPPITVNQIHINRTIEKELKNT